MISPPAVSIRMLLLFTLLVCLCGCAHGRTARSNTMFEIPDRQRISYEYGHVREFEMELPVMGQDYTTSTTKYIYTVEGAGSPGEFRITCDDASMTSISYDPGMGDPRTHDADMSKLIGRVEEVRLNERGLVTSVTDKATDTAVAETGGEGNYQFLFLFLPEVPMTPGVEWTRATSDTIESAGTSMIQNRDVTYRCIEETVIEGQPVWKVAVEGEVTMVSHSMNMEAAGVIKGTIYANRQNSLVWEAEEKSTLSGNLSMMGQNASISMTMTMTVRILR